jgi:4-amino-4-deoxy-L-arabinose transferase-like glycosyltransferase
MVALLSGITLAVADRGAVPWLRALRPLWGVPLMLLAAAPWFVAIGIATEGRFFAEAVGGDMLSKVGSGEESHWGPPGYYALTFGLTPFPAAWIVLRALPSAWRARNQPATRFLLAWAVPIWLLFEAVATKLPHYTLPAFPALMLLGGAWAMDPLRRPAPRWLAWLGNAALAGVAVGLAIAAPALPLIVAREVHPAAFLALPAAALLLWRLAVHARAQAWGRAALAGALLAAPLYAAVLEGMLPRFQAVWIAPRLAAALHQAAGGTLPPERFGVAGYHEPSLLFATGAGTSLLRNGAAAAEFLAGAPPGERIVAVGHRDEAAFRAAARERGLTVRELGSVTGLNYTRGRWLTLNLYRTE